MITIKYKGEIVNLKDIEINWIEYTTNSENNFVKKVGNVEEYAQSKYKKGYKKGYNEGFENGFDAGLYRDV